MTAGSLVQVAGNLSVIHSCLCSLVGFHGGCHGVRVFVSKVPYCSVGSALDNTHHH